MKKGMIIGLAVAAASVVFAQAPAEMDQMMKAFGAAMSGAQSSNSTQLVDFRDLKALLPSEVKGIQRTSATAEKSGAMGMAVAYAEGVYENADGNLNIKITDGAGMGGMMALAQFGWVQTEIDRETDTGYEKTTVVKGHKAMMKYDRADKSGEIEVFVKGRYVVEISGYGVPEDVLKAALDAIDLNKLAALEPKPAA